MTEKEEFNELCQSINDRLAMLAGLIARIGNDKVPIFIHFTLANMLKEIDEIKAEFLE